jgi:predicted nucleotidyltransferase component of viral defense system
MTTNICASVHQRLLNIARNERIDFNALLRRYFQERWLYRLSVSAYAQSFILKGGVLLSALDPSWTRPTRDLDFLARQDNDPRRIAEVVAEICSTEVEDGVVFDPESVKAEPITEDLRYAGVRTRFTGRLGNAVEPLQIDMGFSDVITPGDVPLDFPTLLGAERPQLRAYSRESVVAEKFECMLTLGTANSRLKDLYDIYRMATQQVLKADVLEDAVIATLLHRGTRLTSSPVCLEKYFAENALRQRDWERFLRRNRLSDVPQSFAKVVSEIRVLLMPICSSIAENR